MVAAGALADFVGLDAADALVVADVVHVDLLALQTGQAGVGVAEFVDGEGGDVGEAGDEGGQEDFDVGALAVEGGEFVGEVLGVQLGDVAAEDVAHGVHLGVALADAFDGFGVVGDFALLDSGQSLGLAGLVFSGEGEDFALQLVFDLVFLVVGDGLEQLLHGAFGRTEGVVGLLRPAGGEAHGDAVEASSCVAAAGGETGQLDVLHRRGKKLGQFKVDGRPLDGARAFVGLEDPERGTP